MSNYFERSAFRRHVPLLIGGIALAVVSASAGYAYPGEQLAGQAKITYKEAQSIALKVQPGTIAAGELESEAGGSGLRFSFDIRANAGATHEVGVDAANGMVLENSVEGKNPD